MKKFNQTTALILAALLTLSVFSCSEASPDTVSTGMQTSNAESSAEGMPEIPYDRYDGYEFRVMAPSDSQYSSGLEFVSESENGDILNDAVYKRNRLVEERFGTEVVTVSVPEAEMVNMFNQSVMSGDDSFDMAALFVSNMYSLISNGYCHKLSDLEYVDIEKPYWNTDLINASAVCGDSFFLMGDIGYLWRDGVWCMCYNKRIYEQFGYNDIYSTIREGKWTLELLETQCREVTDDINGDSVIDQDDRWGMLSSKTAGIGLVTSTGINTIDNSGDTLIFDLESERNINVIDRLRRIMTDNSLQLRAEDISGSTDIWTDIINIFREGRALYRISVMRDVVGLRNMEDDFGIIPLPKYDEDQDSYYTTYQAWSAPGYIVPLTVEDTARTSAIIEYMCYVSTDTVAEAYYDTTLQGKVSRDDESIEMLTLIFDSMITDIGLAFGLADMRGLLSGMINSSTDNTASTLESNKESVNAKLKEFEDAIKSE